MTEEQLIARLQALKEIKPREDWVVSFKRNIMKGNQYMAQSEVKMSLWDALFVKRMAYSLATVLLMLVGVFGFAQYTLPGDMLFEVKKITEQSQAALVGESNVKSNIEIFKKRSQDLAQVVKNNKINNKPSAVQEVKDAAKNLVAVIKEDSQLVKEIALEIKNNETLLSVLGEEDIKETSDVLYKTIDNHMINELQQAVLTEEQAIIFEEIKALFDQEKYSQALEKILIINK